MRFDLVRWTIAIFLASGCVLGACGDDHARKQPNSIETMTEAPPPSVIGNDRFNLSSRDLYNLAQNSLSGSREATYKLINYYAMSDDVRDEKMRHTNLVKWQRQALSQGDYLAGLAVLEIATTKDLSCNDAIDIVKKINAIEKPSVMHVSDKVLRKCIENQFIIP